jgi:hypothetical protein
MDTEIAASVQLPPARSWSLRSLATKARLDKKNSVRTSAWVEDVKWTASFSTGDVSRVVHG